LVVVSLAKGAKLGQKDQVINAEPPPLLVKMFAGFTAGKALALERQTADCVVLKLGPPTANKPPVSALNAA
jgi:hypothetical protein